VPAETWLFLNFSYVCPEPVLVKGSFLKHKWRKKKDSFLTAICLRASEQKISLSGKFIPRDNAATVFQSIGYGTLTVLLYRVKALRSHSLLILALVQSLSWHSISSFAKGNEGSNVLFCPPISTHGGTTTGSLPTASSLRWNMAPIRFMAWPCISPFLRKHLLKTADSRHGMIG
jgi:hypothetical protein